MEIGWRGDAALFLSCKSQSILQNQTKGILNILSNWVFLGLCEYRVQNRQLLFSQQKENWLR